MTETVGRPAYQQVADDLRRRIASAELPVGSAIPSTAKLSKTYGVSITVVRAAVAQLRADGLLVGQPGKGVFVRATPEAVAERTVSIEDLSKQIGELRAELRRIESARNGCGACRAASAGQLDPGAAGRAVRPARQAVSRRPGASGGSRTGGGQAGERPPASS